MSKTDVTLKLENTIAAITNKMGVYGCFEVTIGANGRERVDYMTVDTKGVWRCYEIKCSVADFRSKAKHSFVGHYNYFVMTGELYEKVKDEIPNHIGVYTHHLCVKKPKKQELQVESKVLMMSMIRSCSRDARKLYETNNEDTINRYKREISRLQSENNRKSNQIHEMQYEARRNRNERN